jgi:hypothetical protein
MTKTVKKKKIATNFFIVAYSWNIREVGINKDVLESRACLDNLITEKIFVPFLFIYYYFYLDVNAFKTCHRLLFKTTMDGEPLYYIP